MQPQPQPLEVQCEYQGTVLLVEDDELQVELIRTGLERQGFRTISCQFGKSVWELARET